MLDTPIIDAGIRAEIDRKLDAIERDHRLLSRHSVEHLPHTFDADGSVVMPPIDRR